MALRVGQYELVRRIGSGGMAEVWMGRRASVGGAQKSVAIKFMSARVAADERHRRMFLAEARLSMLMTHSNVVQVFDAGEEDGRLYLVMEWIDGLNLAQLGELQRREGKPWAPRLTAYVVGEVLRGLAYAHHLTHEGQPLCVVHRDVSPHNVLVSTSGEVKIADFGVARLTTEETSGLHIKGKLRYMAPEHLAGRSREPTVDLYGVGAMLHELLTGTRFRDEADEVDLYGQILGGYVPPLGVPGVPPELVSLREGLLQADPRQRIPTAARALEYLGAWAGYRNAAGELGALCRATMGVVAPRSGIESAPTQRSVDAEGDTETPSKATHTAGAAATRTSGGAPAVTRTSGAVPAAPSGRPSSMPTQAASRPGPTRRRALLVGASVLGVGFSIGGVAVAVLRGSTRADRRDSDPEPAGGPSAGPPSAAQGGPSESGGSAGASGAEAEAGREGAGLAEAVRPAATQTQVDPAGGESTTGEAGSGTTAEEAGSGTTAEEAGSGTTDAAADGTTGEPSADPSTAQPRRKPARAVVQLTLRQLRTAEVRIGSARATAQPTAELRVAPGRHAIWWREPPNEHWVDGGKLTFVAGGRYKLRVSKSGVEVL